MHIVEHDSCHNPMKHHPFPLPDRTGQRVIYHRTGKEGIIVGRGSCAYYVQMGEAVEVRSAYELDFPTSQPPPRSSL